MNSLFLNKHTYHFGTTQQVNSPSLGALYTQHSWPTCQEEGPLRMDRRVSVPSDPLGLLHNYYRNTHGSFIQSTYSHSFTLLTLCESCHGKRRAGNQVLYVERRTRRHASVPLMDLYTRPSLQATKYSRLPHTYNHDVPVAHQAKPKCAVLGSTQSSHFSILSKSKEGLITAYLSTLSHLY